MCLSEAKTGEVTNISEALALRIDQNNLLEVPGNKTLTPAKINKMKELEDLIEEEETIVNTNNKTDTNIDNNTKNIDNQDNISSDLDNDGEEIKKIAGKGINTKSSDKSESDDLILHLVSTSLSNIHEKWESIIFLLLTR